MGWNIGPDKVEAQSDLKDLVSELMQGWDDSEGDVADAILSNPFVILETDKFVAVEDWIESNTD